MFTAAVPTISAAVARGRLHRAAEWGPSMSEKLLCPPRAAAVSHGAVAARQPLDGAAAGAARQRAGDRPDSVQAIDAVPGQARIFVATGHGHLGLTGAPHTGQLVAELVTGARPSLPLDAYAPRRFAGGSKPRRLPTMPPPA